MMDIEQNIDRFFLMQCITKKQRCYIDFPQTILLHKISLTKQNFLIVA